MRTKFYVACAAGALLLLSCGNNDKEKEAAALVRKVAPPVANVDNGKTTFTIDAAKDTVLTMPSGSTISIPAKALVNADGTPFTGQANVEYEEYLDQAGVILSGIPMEYDSAGQTNSFISAGMFQIDAKSDAGGQLAIAGDKKITVSQASPYEDGERSSGYNFYQFDTVAGQWKYLTKQKVEPTAPAPNTEGKSVNDSKASAGVKKVSDFVFDINVNTSGFSELEGIRDIMWKYSGNRKYPDPEKQAWVFKKSWPVTRLVRDESTKGAYLLVLESAVDTFTTSIVPVEMGSGKGTANLSGEVDKYAMTLGKQASIAIEDYNLRRTIELSNFGIYNWDAIYMFKNPRKMKVRFMADGSPLPGGYMFYQAYLNENVVLKVTQFDAAPNCVVSDDEFVYLAVNAAGEALVCRDVNPLRMGKASEKMDIAMVNTGMKISTTDDLREVLYGF